MKERNIESAKEERSVRLQEQSNAETNLATAKAYGLN